MILMALLVMAVSMIMDIVDCKSINILPPGVNGRASGGLKTKLVVSAR
jgi:hypothetical protein